MSDAKDKIKAHVNEFVNVLSNLVRQAAVEEITEAIKNAAVHTPAPLAQLTNARSERKVVGRKPGVQAKAPIANSSGEQKRTPAQLAELMERVHSTIKATPGQGVGPIAASLGTSSKELSLLLRKLLDDKKVISKGKKRGTRYFPR